MALIHDILYIIFMKIVLFILLFTFVSFSITFSFKQFDFEPYGVFVGLTALLSEVLDIKNLLEHTDFTSNNKKL